MSILDGFPKNEQEFNEVLRLASKIVEPAFATAKLNARDSSIFDLLKEGLSFADICQITKEERDALLARGCQQLQVGDVQAAQDTLTMLIQLEPSDERVIYALAATFQAQANYPTAGKLYVQFLSLDATNPDGYLRLGECFLANREQDGARACFETAKILLGRGKGRPDRIAYADRMIKVLEAQAADAAA